MKLSEDDKTDEAMMFTIINPAKSDWDKLNHRQV
ncbi:MAG: hypothetical protein Ct9H300mP4_12320 [Gammaproteobacteria bacterium]|nr:MAG: hypothetical protein Ct9H300mP4_12320 [Gammaproteobacteria bacterium]